MVEAGDTVSATLKKEFGEEALNSLEATDERKKELDKLLSELFKQGTQVSGLYKAVKHYCHCQNLVNLHLRFMLAT